MTLKKTRLWALLAVCVATPALAQNVVVVNGTPIPKAQADLLAQKILSRLGVESAAQLTTEQSQQLHAGARENLIISEALTQEAIRRGLLSRPDVRAQIAIAQKDALIQALIEDFASDKHNQPTDAEIRARYNQLKTGIQFAPPPLEQVRGQIVQLLLQEKWQAFQNSLRNRARVQ
jgi:peptidyl-prolyl cis-trans isomerase C